MELHNTGNYWILDGEQMPTALSFPSGTTIFGESAPVSNGYSVRCVK
jgi:hypothetical protein